MARRRVGSASAASVRSSATALMTSRPAAGCRRFTGGPRAPSPRRALAVGLVSPARRRSLLRPPALSRSGRRRRPTWQMDLAMLAGQPRRLTMPAGLHSEASMPCGRGGSARHVRSCRPASAFGTSPRSRGGAAGSRSPPKRPHTEHRRVNHCLSICTIVNLNGNYCRAARAGAARRRRLGAGGSGRAGTPSSPRRMSGGRRSPALRRGCRPRW